MNKLMYLTPKQRRIIFEIDALLADVIALKRLQVETAAELDALLPAIQSPSFNFGGTGNRAFKGELR
jgi:hypothetical protein